MVSRCCVPFCKNNGNTKGVSFHKFTKNSKLLKVWIHKIRRDTRKSKNNPNPFQVNKHTKICSDHFVRQDFHIKSERNRLKADAVPSIFPWTSTDSRKTVHSQARWNENTYSYSTTDMQKNTEEELDMNTLNDKSTITCSPTDKHTDMQKNTEEEVDMSTSNDKSAVTSFPVADKHKVCVLEPTQSSSSTTAENSDEGNLNVDNESTVCSTSVSTTTVDLTTNDNMPCSEYKTLLTLYTDLLIKHQTHVEKCRCQNALKSDKAVMATFDPLYKNVTNAPTFFSLERFKDNDSEISYYTSFPNYRILMSSLNMLFEYNDSNLIKFQYAKHRENRPHQHRLSRQDEYFLVLIKLKQNFGYHHLGSLFNISSSTVCNIFLSWINFMYVRFGSLDIWPHREVLQSHYTDEFKENYPNVIGSLDATEIYIQKPSSLLKQSQTFSHYKNSNTVKGLVAVDANGAIIFASALFTGSISDNQLMKSSGFITLIEDKLKKGFLLPGDTLLADKGFTATELLNPININIPVFRISNAQFSENEIHHSQKISHERVHVERAIGHLKNYKILASETPLSFIGTFNQVWTVCCMLSNFQLPLRKKQG